MAVKILFAMKNQRIVLYIAMLFGIAIVGCAKRGAAARVAMPDNRLAQTQLMAYAQSSGFAAAIQAHAAANLNAEVEIAVRQYPNTSLVELRAVSYDPMAAANAANIMAAVLQDYAVKNDLGKVELTDPAQPPKR